MKKYPVILTVLLACPFAWSADREAAPGPNAHGKDVVLVDVEEGAVNITAKGGTVVVKSPTNELTLKAGETAEANRVQMVKETKDNGKAPDAEVALPEARVLAVKPELGLVMLSVGSNHGAKPGDRMTISRSSQFVAKAEIQKVYPDMCSAKLLDKQGDVQTNDAVEVETK